MSALDLAGIDAALARYRGAADAISVNLLELDADPNRQLLDSAPLSGETGAAWADARAALTRVWDWFARFTTFLDQAAALRGAPRSRLSAGRERRAADFLTGASIQLSHDDVPLRDRDLLQLREATSHCTADALLERMTTEFALARDVVARVANAWDDLAPRVAAARARTIGLTGSSQGEAMHGRVDALSDLLVTDPLAVHVDDVAAIEADLDVIAVDEQAREQLGRDVLARIRDAHARLDVVTRAAADARRAWETTRAKIARPEVPPPPVVDGELVRAVNDIADRADAGRWRDANRDLDALADALDALEAALASAAESCRTALAQRDHLRGRLDAYRAKAHRLDLDEDDEVTSAYEQALEVLHVAPADLTLASELVTKYQRQLTPTPEPEARR
jgi:hypothetical protein